MFILYTFLFKGMQNTNNEESSQFTNDLSLIAQNESEESKNQNNPSSIPNQVLVSDRVHLLNEPNLVQDTHVIYESPNETERIPTDNPMIPTDENNPSNQNRDETNRNLDNEFYQHSLSYLVQNLNNLRDTLQNMLNNEEVIQGLRINSQNNGDPQYNAMNNFMQEEGQERISENQNFLNLNPNRRNIRQEALIDQQLLNNPERINRQNSILHFSQLFNSFEGSLRQFATNIGDRFNLIFWMLVFVSIILGLLGTSNLIKNIHFKNADYTIQWLAYNKNSRLLLLVSSTLTYQ